MQTKRKVAIYSRVSTLHQAEEGYSISQQIEALTKYCQAMGWAIYDNYSDGGFSGGKLERPAMQQMIQDAKSSKFDTVIVYKLDRLSRNVRDTLYLVKDVFNANNVDFVSLQENIDTKSAMGNLFITLLSAIAEFEREQIKERMQLGVKGRAKSGKTTSWTTPPFGYEYDTNTQLMTINHYQAEIVRDMFDKIISGWSIMGITTHLRKTNNKKWTHVRVKRILENVAYIGKVKYRDEIFDGEHAPILTEEIFYKAQKALEERTSKKDNTRPFQGLYMLSNIAKCGYCGTPLKIDSYKPRKDGTRKRTYTCINRNPKRIKTATYNDGKQCKESGRYDVKDVERYVLNEISKLQLNPKSIESLYRDKPEENITAHQERLKKLETKLSKLNDLYINELISMEALKQKSAELLKEKSSLETFINNNKRKINNKPAFEKVAKMDDVFKMSYDDQKKIVKTLIKRVEVKRDEINVIFKL